jgi:DNA polymerase
MGRETQTTAARYLDPLPRSLTALARRASDCEACPLYIDATQTVFGHGPRSAAIVMVGEQPGDQEDRKGLPFVGPAGRILDAALADAKIDREAIYLTNMVKHFKFTTRAGSKRRLHAKPNSREIRACAPWFDAEWAVLENPRVLVCLGATAAQAILGRAFRITRQRGKFAGSTYTPATLATWHPSAILRARDEDRDRMSAELVADLKLVRKRAARVRSG